LRVTLRRKEARLTGHLADLFPTGIPLGEAPNGPGVADHPGVMVAQDGALAGHAGHDGLAASGEAGEKVGLDETGQDLQVAAHELGVEPRLVAPRRRPDVHLGRTVETIVLDDSRAPEVIVTQHDPELGLGVGPVRPQGVEKYDLDIIGPADLIKHGAEKEGVGSGPRDIAEDDADSHPRTDELLEGRGTDRAPQGVPEGGRGVGNGGNVARFDDGDVERIVELERQSGLSIG
jgi:hypothetical protein